MSETIATANGITRSIHEMTTTHCTESRHLPTVGGGFPTASNALAPESGGVGA
ncbi:hypothetical protein Huta_1503 [Halorhabdus utahensis DSM 12940]|uniref:Uncharacterized protein n=1 Tax=Halorhabdus utahensis (strain DSM 12940 / JCM 11049 / AX-2) TaxID=519442 RepID=C7NP91_HALUD|nr:hypothetical protein [Halorhabdus utahensis]ACV11678.1 hypothetical protein Huta_1503 [Halorhabdus utahensis DSM 12940]